jgi:hypothetical protein
MLIAWLELRRTPIVIGQLLWRPFDVRFENFLGRLKFHRQVLQDEQNIIHLKTLVSSIELQAEERKQAEEFSLYSQTYFNLLKSIAEKITGAELSELY